jgi:SNF2 family DNA or RNA helicase
LEARLIREIQIDDSGCHALIDGTAIRVSPEELLNARVRGADIQGHQVPATAWPAGIDIAQFPVRIRVGFGVDDGAVAPYVEMSTRFSGQVRLTHLPRERLVLIDQQWHPIGKDDWDALLSLLSHAPGETLSAVSFADYVGMCRHPAARELLGDRNALDPRIVALLVGSTDESAEPDLAPGVALRPYQRTGLCWMSQMTGLGVGGILADEMGLGKTLQVIALLAGRRKSASGPALLVVPSSLIENWKRELVRFAPQISWLIHRGSARTTNKRDLLEFDLVITTYGIMANDKSLLAPVAWSLIICDEAHIFRNPETQHFKAIEFVRRNSIDAPAIAITGTPIQNSLRDSWALFEYVVPGYCGDRQAFAGRYVDDVSGAIALEPYLSPFMLRRLVRDVAKELPDLIQIPEPVEMSESEALGYDNLRIEKTSGPGGMLAAMTPLRMCCSHPRLVLPEWWNVPPTDASKFLRLVEIMQDIQKRHEKALIFTSYNEMSRTIARYLTETLGFWTDTINGETPVDARQPKIDAFTAHPGPAVLVLNPQAAGVGLNIQAANHVIHYNLEWNPAVEEQATARAYRSGQTRRVIVRRLFYVDTIEEVINARVELKRSLITHAVRGVTGEDTSDLALALSLTPVKNERVHERHPRS